jgi:hypothetical protein
MRSQLSAVTSGHDDAASALTTPTTIVAAVNTAAQGNVAQGNGENSGSQFGQQSRSIGALTSGDRQVGRVRSEICQLDSEYYGYLELDSHADTCTVGANC